MNHHEMIERVYRRQWELPTDQEVWRWAEDNLGLYTSPTPRTGRFSTSMNPWMREALEDFRDPDIREIVLCWGSQTGKTTVLQVGGSYLIVNEPSPILWMFPNESLARTFSENRWITFINDNQCLKRLLPPDPRRTKFLAQPFAGAPMLFIGSNSPANVSSNPARYVIMDEVDKLAEQSNKEANAVYLAEQRAKAYWPIRKIAKTSTPTVPDAPIWDSFLAGDRRRLFLPCPHCSEIILPVLRKSLTALPETGHEAELIWDQRKLGEEWDEDKIRDTIHLTCPKCGRDIKEHSKTRMVREGTWQATARPKQAWRRSRHLSSLYSLEIPWADIALEFLNKKESLDGLQGFINGILAEPYQHQDERQERREAVVEINSDDDTGERPIARIITGDVQGTPPNWFVCREWFNGGHSRLVEWGTWQTYDEYEEHRMRLMVQPDLTGLDSGFDAAEVYRQCALWGWFALRGDDQSSWPLHRKGRKAVRVPWMERKFDPYMGTAKAGQFRRITELRWSNPTIKDILARLRNSEKSPVRWEIPEAFATDEYFRHLDGEYRASSYNRKTGRTDYFWRQRGRRWPNHLFDCECMQLAVAIRTGILKTAGGSDEE